MKEPYTYPEFNKNSLVFEIGGYQGDGMRKMYEQYKCDIYVFEPIKEYYDAITKDVKAFNFGLSDTTRTARINVAKDGSSLHYVITDKFIDIELICIKDFIHQENIKHVDLMNVNIEGEEYNLLPYMIKEGLMPIFDYVQIQFHDATPDCVVKRDNIHKGLSLTHTLSWSLDFIWELWEKKI